MVITLATTIIPEISITLVGETNSSLFTLSSYLPESPVFVTTPTPTSTRLVVPPRPSDGPSRRTLVQRGLRLGSFRLNCTESQVNVVIPSTPRRTFNWSKSTQPQGPPTTTTNPIGNGTRRGHSRARSLNSLADLNETLKMNMVQPSNNGGGYIPKHGLHHHHHHHHHSQRTPSIDLSILGFTSSSNNNNPSHHFASAL